MDTEYLGISLPPRCVIDGKAAMIAPHDLWRLEGKTITGTRLFLLVCGGAMTVRIDGRRQVLTANTLVDMYDRTTICLERTDSGCEAYCLIPTLEFVEEALKTFRVGDEEYLWHCMLQSVKRISAEGKKTLERQMRLLEDTFTNIGHRHRTELAELYFKSFQMELSNLVQTEGTMEEDGKNMYKRHDALAMDFMALVWKHFREEHRTDFYARKLNISTKHLMRVVKESTGITPHDIIVGELLHHAVSMLEQNRYTIQQVAAELNFADLPSFSKFFKKHKHVSPTAYMQEKRS